MSRNFRNIERKSHNSNKPYYRPSWRQNKLSINEIRGDHGERIVLHERKTWHVAGEEEDEECDEEEEDKKERMEETVSEVQNMQMTSSQVVDVRKNCLKMHHSSSVSERQDSSMSGSSSFWNNDTSGNSKKAMSLTPRFTYDELQTVKVQTILARRQKQIQYGKIQECYRHYLRLVPRTKRTRFHPQTPDIHRKYSRRGFDTLIRVWKKQLHAWEIKLQSSSLELPLENAVAEKIINEPVPLKSESEDGSTGNATDCHFSHRSSFYASSIKVKVETEIEGSSIMSYQEISNAQCSESDANI